MSRSLEDKLSIHRMQAGSESTGNSNKLFAPRDTCASAAIGDLGLKEGREGLAEVDVGVNALKLCALLTPKFILALLDE